MSTADGKPAPAPAPAGWTLEFSKRVGRYYYSNKATKESLWEYPPPHKIAAPSAVQSPPSAAAPSAVAAPASSTGAAPTARAAAAVGGGSAAVATRDGDVRASRPQSATPTAGLDAARKATAAEGESLIDREMRVKEEAAAAVKAATEQFLSRLQRGLQDLLDDPEETSYRIPPPLSKVFRDLASDEAEDAGLLVTIVGVGDDKTVVIYKPGTVVPELEELESYQREQEEEARADQIRTEKLLQQQRANAAKAVPAAPVEVEGSKIVPLFKVRDKRSVAEVQEEMLRKRKLQNTGQGFASTGEE